MGYILGNERFPPPETLTIYPNPNPQHDTHQPRPPPETLTLTLNVVPYYGSLSWVSISIEKWVINRVMGYKLGNVGIPPTETLNMIPTNRDPQPETPTIYPNPRPQL